MKGKLVSCLVAAVIVLLMLVGCATVEPDELLIPSNESVSSAPTQTEEQSPPEEPDPVQTHMELTLNGDQMVVLEVGQSFEDPGAAAFGWLSSAPDDKETVEVQVEGTVLSDMLGTYVMTYTASYGGETKHVIRQVVVMDRTAPVIILSDIPAGEDPLQVGFAATDNYDGEITHLVTVKVEDQQITYTVSDSSGNTAAVHRQWDRIPPQITLSGEAEYKLSVGDKWDEPGFAAVDSADGDLTQRVEISGSVDTSVPGEYILEYRVTDSCGNAAVVQRTVRVVAAAKPEVVEPNGKVIYLTFDDGPSEYTERLLKILRKYDVKATFFVINSQYIHLLDDIVADGHTLAIHSKTHRYEKIYASEEAYFDDLYAMQQIIYEKTGVTATVMRFPGGSSNRVSKKYCTGIMTRLIQAVQDRGFQFFDWNVDSDDAGSANTAEQVFQNVKKGVKGKQYSVVLQHDTRKFSVDAVERIIVWGLENGYTFLPLEPSSPECHHDWVKN